MHSVRDMEETLEARKEYQAQQTLDERVGEDVCERLESGPEELEGSVYRASSEELKTRKDKILEVDVQEHLQGFSVRVSRVLEEVVKGVSQACLPKDLERRPCHPRVHVKDLWTPVRGHPGGNRSSHLPRPSAHPNTTVPRSAASATYFARNVVENMAHVAKVVV